MRVTPWIVIALFIVVALAPVAAAQDSSGAYKVGDDVKAPVVTKQVNPSYTVEAKRQGIQGSVEVEAVVREDGSVGEVKVTRSLDREYGLDDEALKAAKHFEFKPGTKKGKPVPVRVTIEFTFSMK